MEEKHRTITETSLDGFTIDDLEGRVIEVNDSYCKMLGYTREELLGKPISFIEVVETPEDTARRIKKIVEQGSDHFDTRHKRKDGKIIDVEISVNYLDIGGGQLFVFARDITEQKQMEKKYKAIVGTALDGFTVNNLEGEILEVNDSYCEMLGYTREELLEMSISDIEAIESPENTSRHVKRIMEQGYDRFDTRHKRKDGKTIDVDVKVNYLDMGEAQFFVFIRDITKQKQIGEPMLALEEKYRVVFENTGTATAIIAQDMTILLVNEECERLFGYSKEELQGKRRWTEFVAKEDLERMKEYHKLRRKDPASVPRNYEFRAIDRKGNVKDISIITEMIRGTTNSVASLLDITKQKQAEQALWARDKKVKRIFESVKDAVVVTDLNGVIVDLNEETLRISGFVSKGELMGKNTIESIASYDRERALEDMQELALQGVAGTREYTLIKADGSEYPAEISADVLKDNDGNTVGFVSAIRDITERKQIERIRKIFNAESRKRISMLEERFIKYDLKDFSNPEIIALLLHHTKPYKECKKLMDEITKKYKNLSELLSAPVKELEQIPGITSHDILCFQLLREVPKVFLKERIINQAVPKSSKEIFDYLYYSMQGLRKEVFKVAYLDSQNKIIDAEDLFEGTLNGIHIYPREIEAGAIKHNATGLVFAHNHPSGDPTPSRNDKQITRDLVFIGKVLQIKVIDHIIIGENKYFSFADAGLITQYEDEFLNLRIHSLALKK